MIKANKKLAEEWFRIAESDLKFAHASFRDFAAFYPQICFLCQQSAKKYLKGFLVFHRKRFLIEHYPAGKNDAQSAIGIAEAIRQFIYAKII